MPKRTKRKTGLTILGDVPWGTHFCQFYKTKEDLLDILVPYFKAGLENNEFCLWVTAEPLTAEEARAALHKAVKNLDQYVKKGQIEILDFSQWYTVTGKFEADKVLQGWVAKEQQARKNGFEGLRLTGNTFWIEKKDWQSFSGYEAVVNRVIHKHKMLAICSYSLDKCGTGDLLDVFSTHQFVLINRDGKWIIIESSDRRQAEEELKVIQARLSQSEKMAATGKLVAKIAHEINNPLATILGFIQVYLSELSLDDPKYKDFKKIEAAALRCRETVRKLSGQS